MSVCNCDVPRGLKCKRDHIQIVFKFRTWFRLWQRFISAAGGDGVMSASRSTGNRHGDDRAGPKVHYTCPQYTSLLRGAPRALTLRNVDGPSLELVLGSRRWPS